MKKHNTLAAKVLAWIILIVGACTMLAMILGISFLSADSFYMNSYSDAVKGVMANRAGGFDDAWTVLDAAANKNYTAAKAVSTGKNITFRVTDSSGRVLYDNLKTTPKLISFRYIADTTIDGSTDTYTVTCNIDASFPNEDSYAKYSRLCSILYSQRINLYVYAVLAAAAAFAAFLYLMHSAGRRSTDNEIHPGPLQAIPGDLAVLGYLACMAIAPSILSSSLYPAQDIISSAVYEEILFLIEGCLLASCLLDIAVRVKCGGYWHHTLIGWILRSMKSVLSRMSIVPRTVLIVLGVSLLEAMCILLFGHSGYALFWFFKTAAVFCLLVWAAEMLKDLLNGTRALAEGNLSSQVDVSRLKGDFREAGENLNHIAVGMNAAVEERMKSERMKTELITNVSHDIKTPLTSIINYTDLIAKEPTDNQNIREYTEVLTRQSTRLKKLIEDLIEASKASTGNLEVHLGPVDAGVMLTQAAGEYEQRMKSAGLELIITQPEQPVMIMADGRWLWRVMDNLMVNICKYALPGTRVYLDLEARDKQALISFKNTSREPLNISAEELMGRFVRGDSSRSTEGSGLGLSIAESLTELQKGAIHLTVDGDLFKAELLFPLIAEAPEKKELIAPAKNTQTQALNQSWIARQQELQKNYRSYYIGAGIIAALLLLLVLSRILF